MDSRIRTIATNGKVIYIRSEWICQLPMVTRAAIIAHTISAARCYSFRREKREARRFDAASDLEVYTLLKAEKVAMTIKPDYADQFSKHHSVEEIYNSLPENVSDRSEDADATFTWRGVSSFPNCLDRHWRRRRKRSSKN